MKTMNKTITVEQIAKLSLQKRYQDGEGGEGGEGGGGTAGGVASVRVKKDEKGREYFETESGKRLFTQEHLSFEVGEARKSARTAAQTENEKLLKQLNELRAAAEEKGQNVDALTARITELEEAGMSIEDKYKRDSVAWEQRIAESEKKRADEVAAWRQRHNDRLISTEVMAAAQQFGAYSFETLHPIIAGSIKVVEEVDPKTKAITGIKAVAVQMTKSEDGKDIRNELPISEYVKQMREDVPRYGHLFKKDVNGGAGSTTLLGGSADGNTGGGETGIRPGMGFEKYSAEADKTIGKASA